MAQTQQTNTERSRKAEELGADMILQVLEGEEVVGAEEEALLLEEDGSSIDSNQQQEFFENVERAARELGVYEGKEQGDFVDVPKEVRLKGRSWIEPDAGTIEVEMVAPPKEDVESVQESLRQARDVVERAVGIYNRATKRSNEISDEGPDDELIELWQAPIAPGMVSKGIADFIGEDFYTPDLLGDGVNEENLDYKAWRHSSEALKDRIAQHNRVMVDHEGNPMAFPIYGTASLQLTGTPRKQLDEDVRDTLSRFDTEEVKRQAEEEDPLTALKEALEEDPHEVMLDDMLDEMDDHIAQLHGKGEGPAYTALTDFVFADFYGSPQVEDGELVDRSVRHQTYRHGLNHEEAEAFDEPVVGDNPRIRQVDSLEGFYDFLKGFYAEFGPEKSAGELEIAEKIGLEEDESVTVAVPAEVTEPYEGLEGDTEVMVMYESDEGIEETRTEMKANELPIPVDNYWMDPRLRPSARGALEIRTLPNIDFDSDEVRDTTTASAFREAYGKDWAELIDCWRQDMMYMGDAFIAELPRIQAKFAGSGIDKIPCEDSRKMSRELAAKGTEDYQYKGVSRDELMYSEGGIVDLASDYLERERGIDGDAFAQRMKMRVGITPDGEDSSQRMTPAHLYTEMTKRYGGAA